MCLKKTELEWYQTNLLKSKEYNWEDWRTSFLKVFSNKVQSSSLYAYNFKYISTSYVDYAIKKERLIWEVERKTIENTRTNLIFIGLPIHIQDRIDKEVIHSTDDLIRILGQYKGTYHKKSSLTKFR